MTTKVKIAIDVMGSDKGPQTIIEASSISKTRYPEIKYTYFGDSKLILKYVEIIKSYIIDSMEYIDKSLIYKVSENSSIFIDLNRYIINK